MIRPLLVVAVVGIPASLPGLAQNFAPDSGPSFSCAAATTPVEQAICSDQPLSRLDRSLESVFRRTIAAEPESRMTILDGQRRWLKDRGRRCLGPGDAGQAACLVDLYKERIAELNRLTSPVRDLTPQPVQTLRVGPDGRIIAR